MLCQTPPHAVTRRVLLRVCLAASTLQTLVGCRSTLLPTYQEPPSGGVTMYLIAGGWHTEIALPIRAIHDPLRALTPDFPGSQYLLFGWGERNYYMARAPTFRDAMRALFRGPAVLLVTPLYSPPRDSRADAQVFEVALSTAALRRPFDPICGGFEEVCDGSAR